MADDRVPAGPILDDLGVRLDLDRDERVTECLVIAKTTDLASGRVALVTASSTGLDWIARRGLLTAAAEVCQRSTELTMGDDEDEP